MFKHRHKPKKPKVDWDERHEASWRIEAALIAAVIVGVLILVLG